VPSGTALLVIDMQRDIVEPGSPVTTAGAKAIIPRLAALVGRLRGAGIPVIHLRRVYDSAGESVEKVRRKQFFESGGFLVEATRGAEIIDELAPGADEAVFTRSGWSAFKGTGLEGALRQMQIRRVILTGADLPNAIRQTAYDALTLGLDVTALRDGTASQRPDVHEANLADLARVGVKVDTCLEVIREAESGLLSRP
jgi:nicotinamidase-related amidase